MTWWPGALTALQVILVQFPAPHGSLQQTVIPVPGIRALFWLLQAPGMRMVHILTCRQNSNTYKIMSTVNLQLPWRNKITTLWKTGKRIICDQTLLFSISPDNKSQDWDTDIQSHHDWWIVKLIYPKYWELIWVVRLASKQLVFTLWELGEMVKITLRRLV